MRKLDVLASIVGISILVLLIPLIVIKDFHPIYLIAVGLGIICITLYLVNRNRFEERVYQNSKWFIAGSIVFFMIAWVAFLMRSEEYVKPLTYYIFIACATGLAFLSKSRLVVVVACLIGLTHIWTENLLFPSSLIGLDTWTHQMIVANHPGFSAETWSRSAMHYWLHLFNFMDYKWSSLIFVSSIQVILITVFTYLVGRKLWNEKVGYVASLLIVNANWVISFSEWAIPNSLGAVYGLITIYLVLKIREGKRWLLIPAYLIIILAYYTHFIAMVWVLGTFVCMWLVPYLFKKLNIREIARQLPAPIVISLIVLALFHFSGLGETIQKAVGPDVFEPSFGMTYAVGAAKAPDDAVTESILTESILTNSVLPEMTVDTLGMLIYIGIGIIGCLILLRTDRTKKAYVVLSLTVLLIGFIPHLFGISLIEHRWWYYTEVLLAIPLAVALISFNNRWLTAVLLVALVFLSSIGWMSNNTNRMISPNLIVRYALTSEETEGLDHISYRSIGTDPIYYNFLQANLNNSVELVNIKNEILINDFDELNVEVIILREALYKEPYAYGAGTIYKLDFNPVDKAIEQGYEVEWRNEGITLLSRGYE